MFTKKRLILFAIQFPITLLVGTLLYFAYSLRFHEEPTVDWAIAVGLALGLDIVITLWNMRDERRHQHAS